VLHAERRWRTDGVSACTWKEIRAGALIPYWETTSPARLVEKKCPKHGVSYVLRQNAKTKEVAIACPLCNAEAHGGNERDVAAVANLIAKRDEDQP
jgi:hypothetical protein